MREEFLKIKKVSFMCGMEKTVEREMLKLLERLKTNDERGPKEDERG